MDEALDLGVPLYKSGYSVLMTKHGERSVGLLLESLAQKPTSKATVLVNSGNDPVVVVLSEQDLRGDALYRLQEFANIYLSTEETQ